MRIRSDFGGFVYQIPLKAHLRTAASTNCHSHCTFSSTLQTHFPVWPSIFRLFHLLCTTPSTRHIVLLLGKVRWIVRLCGGVWNTILNNLLPCKWQPGTNDRFDATFKWMRSQWGSSTYSLLYWWPCISQPATTSNWTSGNPNMIERVLIKLQNRVVEAIRIYEPSCWRLVGSWTKRMDRWWWWWW